MNLKFVRDKRAIIHLDADAFFASCEQALNPKYKGRPLVTGKERNIVSAASYEAKALGVKRGVTLWDAKKICPDLIVLPSNYETYSLFSQRMAAIIKRFTSQLESYSIDEFFIDITGLRRTLHKSYPEIAKTIKNCIFKELGITVSVGLSYTKVLAKIASKYKKPNGFTHIHSGNISHILEQTKINDVWGIGNQTTYHLQKYNIKNAWEFSKKPSEWIDKVMTKPHKELHYELNGKSIYEVINVKPKQKGISKTKTFSPATNNKNYLFAQLSKNLENAFIKCRRHNLAAGRMNMYLKTKDFKYQGLEIRFNRATCFPNEVMPLVKNSFDKIFNPSLLYRATGIWLHHLQCRDIIQLNLFEQPLKIYKLEKIFAGIDKLSAKYGKHTVFLGSSYMVHNQPDYRQKNRSHHIRGSRKFINLPFLGEAN